MNVAAASIGIGLVVNLGMAEIFGLTAGGMVVPGYLAMALDEPWHVAATLVAAVVTWGMVRLVSLGAVVYGRRRTALFLLGGFISNAGLASLLEVWLPEPSTAVATVGHIIPGLIAMWLDRQGALATTATLCISTILTKLALIAVVGG